MRMKSALAFVLGFAVSFGATVIQARNVDISSSELPPPGLVKLIGITYGGSGCPSSSIGSILSDDNQILTLIFDKYGIEYDPKKPDQPNRRNCQLNLNFRYPSGFQFSPSVVDCRVHVKLGKGDSISHKCHFYFSGQTLPPCVGSKFFYYLASPPPRYPDRR